MSPGDVGRAGLAVGIEPRSDLIPLIGKKVVSPRHNLDTAEVEVEVPDGRVGSIVEDGCSRPCGREG